MTNRLLNEQISLKEFSEEVFQSANTTLALNFYKIFGHVGTFDILFLNSDLKYMLRFPQIYFSKTYSGPIPDSLKNVSEKFQSKVFTESFNPDLTSLHLELGLRNVKRVYTNKDGNFVMRSSSFEFVSMFKNSILTISSSLKKDHFSP